MDCPKAIALGVACTLFPTAQGERHYIATNRNILAQLGSPDARPANQFARQRRGTPLNDPAGLRNGC